MEKDVKKQVIWNAPETERQRPHDLTHKQSLKVDHEEVERSMVVIRGSQEVEKDGEGSISGHSVTAWT